jgi:hypothetical protein
LPRPRIEVDFLPDSYTRTGRKLIVSRAKGVQTIKKELYEIRFDLTAHVYAGTGSSFGSSSGEALGGVSGDSAGDAAWLESFENAFVAALPRGVNDQRGNWIQIRVNQATFKTGPTKRVGTKDIKVFLKIDTMFLITLTGRVTTEEEQALLTTFGIVPGTGARE